MMMKTISVPAIHIPVLSEAAISDALDAHGAAAAIDCVNWKAFPYKPQVGFRIAHTGTHLLVKFTVNEQFTSARLMDNYTDVWDDSCIEMFIDDCDGIHYYNIEINCIGTRLAARRTGRYAPEMFPPEKMKQILVFTSLPHEPIDIRDRFTEWTVVEAIPFALIGKDSCPCELRANFYKIGDKTAVPHYLSWSPIESAQPDFHLREFFGRLILE